MPSILPGQSYQPPKNPLDDFDPNNSPSPFATYAPNRRPAWKLHATRASALGAMSNQRGYGGCSLYTWENNRWAERVRYQPRNFVPARCDMCSAQTVKEEERWDYRTRTNQKTGRMVNTASQVLERVRHGRSKLCDPLKVLTLCRGCKQGMGY